ncbi:MAG TPA: sortase [Chloroflexi bacterium]|nr:sortase [Chloroflexota bacterium]
MTSGQSHGEDASLYRQKSLWEAPQWEPLPEPEAPRLSQWPRALRVILGARVLTLLALAAATLLGSGYALGVPESAVARSVAEASSQATVAPRTPEPTIPPTTAPETALAPSPTPLSTITAAATRTPTTAPSATQPATLPPSAPPMPTEDTSLVVTAPSATPGTAGEPAPTVVYPIGPPPVRLVIPSIGVDIPVVTVGTVKQTVGGQTYEVWDTAVNAGAYHNMSAPPGYVGNTVINGHRDIHGKVFADLDKVRVGDPITVYTEEHEFIYTVTEILEVPEKYASPEQRAENQRLIGYLPENRLTLITCTPYGTNLNRLLIIAHPAGQPAG